jgi:hypothetical protein
MPTILQLSGWRFYFFSHEGTEPVHIHCAKGDARAKYWLHPEIFEITEAYAQGMSPADKRIIRKIIFDHFDYFLEEWNAFQELKNGRDSQR